MPNTGRQVIDLAGIRADGWFEQLGAELKEMEQLCAAVGHRFVAFSFVASVRIISIRYNPRLPDSSEVEFALSDGEAQRLSLADFRERLGTALLELPEPSFELGDGATPEDIRDCIGRRNLLLAPVFGVRLSDLHYGGGQPPAVTLELAGVREELELSSFQEILNNAIRSEVARSRPNAPFSIDFKKVGQAEEANRSGDYDMTIALLGSWPAPLSVFLRTPQGQALGSVERVKLMRGLCALAQAYLHNGLVEIAEDVLRLGIQFGQELTAAGPLFGVLSQMRVAAGRYGEAIGLLQRALSLGVDPPSLLPDLARCFVERRRYVAALACVEQAALSGVDDAALAPLRERVEAGLGEAYRAYRRQLG